MQAEEVLAVLDSVEVEFVLLADLKSVLLAQTNRDDDPTHLV